MELLDGSRCDIIDVLLPSSNHILEVKSGAVQRIKLLRGKDKHAAFLTKHFKVQLDESLETFPVPTSPALNTIIIYEKAVRLQFVIKP